MQQSRARHPSRRQFLGKAATAAAAPFFMPFLPIPAGAESPLNVRFRVLVDGSPIGDHRIVFHEVGNLLVVETHINIEVMGLFGPVFQFKHNAEEAWDSGHLVSVRSTTNNNGTFSKVSGSAFVDGFHLVSENGPFLATKATMSSNALWDSRILLEKRLIDVQHGSEIGLVARHLADERVDTPWGSVKASRYRLITPFFAGSVFYDSNRRWVRAQIEVNGVTIDYALAR